jgi:hypothetical protein
MAYVSEDVMVSLGKNRRHVYNAIRAPSHKRHFNFPLDGNMSPR